MNQKIASAAAVLALGASLALAGPHDGGRGRGRAGAINARMAARLNLSDAQKTAIRAIESQFRSDNADFLQTFRQTMQDFHAAREADDRARMDALKPALEAQREQMRQLRTAQREKIRSVLTADQQAQLDAFRAEHRSRRDGRD